MPKWTSKGAPRRSTLVARTRHITPPVLCFRFYEQQVLLRFAKMIWSWALCKPAMETRTLSFGRRLSFLGDPYRLAVLQNNGEVVLHNLQQHDASKVFPPHNDTPHGGHCICFVPNTHSSLGIGTDRGIAILFQQKLRRRPTKWATRLCEEDSREIVDCIDFHPNGSNFVTAGPTAAGFCVRDVIHGFGRRITAGINRVTELRYSPCGNYIAASGVRLFGVGVM